ncbi:MAG: ABC transporter permease, partial [Treponema sp.]|nr:ABC transporter permease [Treponema sp.]
MNFKSSFLFAKRIIFPKSGRITIARKSLGGAILCVGISLIPLVVVLAVSNGMINGITRRMISLSSSHLEAVSFSKDFKALEGAAQSVSALEDVAASYPMIESSALAVSNARRSGVSIRALPPETFEKLSSYRELFEAEDGSISDFVRQKKSVMIG